MLGDLTADTAARARVTMVVWTSLATGAVTAVAIAYGDARTVVMGLLSTALIAATARCRTASVTTVVFFFLYFSLVRRIFPFLGSGADPAAIIPLVACLPLAWRAAATGARRDIGLFSAWCTISVAVGTVSVGVAGWFSVVPCLLAGNAITNSVTMRAVLARRLVLLSMPAFTYTIYQYFHTPIWDVRWLVSVGLVSVGTPGTSDFRPFGPFASPATAAFVAVIIILCCVFGGDNLPLGAVLRVVGGALAAGALIFTQTRAAWLALLAGLLAGLLLGKGRHKILKVLAAGIGGATIFLIPTLNGVVMSRGQSLADLQGDRSFNDRFELLTTFGQYVSVLGRGIGAYSSGSRAVADSTLDNTFVVLIGELGVLGLVLGACILIRQVATRQQLPLAIGVALLVAAAAAPVLSGVTAFLSLALGVHGRINERPTPTSCAPMTKEPEVALSNVTT